MDVPTHDELIEAIDAFLLRHSMKDSRLSRDATGEPALVARIRAGSSPTLDTLNKLKAFMGEKDAEADLARSADAARAA